VPSIRAEGGQPSAEGQGWIADHLTRRRLLNELIRDYATSKAIAYVDLFHATADPATHQLAAMYSNDGVHLTTAGYRKMAEEAAAVLKPMLASKR
jgi:acyl-CoA thioesterase I